MHDQLSRYKTLRLSIHPRTDGKSVDWALVATRTWNGVPTSRILASGRGELEAGLESEEDCMRAVVEIAAREFG